MFTRIVSFSCAVGLLGCGSSSAAQDAPVILKPSSAWHVDYGEDHCRLARQFGSKGQETVFYLEQYEPGDEFTVLAAGPGFSAAKLRNASVRFGPDGASAGADRITQAEMAKFGSGVMVTSMRVLPDNAPVVTTTKVTPGTTNYLSPPMLRTLDPADVAHLSSFELVEEDSHVARLMLGGMGEPIKALNACTDELLTHWGIDVAAHKTRSRGVIPKSNPGAWISAGDYPIDLMRAGTQGVVHFRLDVDERGRATRCSIQQSTRPAEFDRVVCSKISRNARFEPALDSAGEPMKSYWRSTVRFELPN